MFAVKILQLVDVLVVNEARFENRRDFISLAVNTVRWAQKVREVCMYVCLLPSLLLHPFSAAVLSCHASNRSQIRSPQMH
jgi:hypothetical protein